MSNDRNILNHIQWKAKVVPRPKLVPTTHTIDHTGLRKLNADPFINNLIRNERSNYMTLHELLRVVPLYHELVLAMENFAFKYCAEFDIDILKTTTALSLVRPNHTFLDEFGAFTLTKKSKIRLADPSEYMKRYEMQVADIREIVASYPRGKNTGLPIIVSGKNRFTSNVVNVINLISASIFQNWMYEDDFNTFKNKIDEVIAWLESQFGYATSQVVFSRLQHTGKEIPVTFPDMTNAWFASNNLFPRRRIVNSTIKYIAMALKAAVKVVTEIDLSCPVFEQDRDSIKRRIQNCYAKNGVVLAIDQSRYDLRHGGDKMEHLYNVVLIPRFKRVFGRVGEHLAYLSKIEAMSDTIIPTRNEAYAGSGLLVLKSGESMTSRKGSWMNLVDDMTLTRESLGMSDESVNRYFLKYQPSVILGDDLLKLFPSHDDAVRYINALADLGPKMGLGMDLERPSKFLGKLIVNARDPYNTSPNISRYFNGPVDRPDWIQPFGSILQKTVFPERFKSERFPTFAAIIKFVVLPYGNIKPDEIASDKRITEDYLSDVRNFLTLLGEIRRRHGDNRASYFTKAAENFPITRQEVAQLYKNLLVHPDQFGLDVTYDFDEILNALFKGLEFDINWSVVGLDIPIDDKLEGKLKDVTTALVEDMSPDSKAAEFVVNLIREANSNYRPDPDFVKFIYDTVIRYHKLLGLRYSPGLPIY